MEKPRVRIFTDYKSPYAFVASKWLFELEERDGVELQWLAHVDSLFVVLPRRTTWPSSQKGGRPLFSKVVFSPSS